MKKLVLASAIALTATSAFATTPVKSDVVTFSADVPAVCSFVLNDNAGTLGYTGSDAEAVTATVASNAIGGQTTLTLVGLENNITRVDGAKPEINLNIADAVLPEVGAQTVVTNTDVLDLTATVNAEAKELVAGNQSVTATVEINCSAAQ